MKVTVTTFNVENLFNRYAFLNRPWDERDYEKFVQAIGLVSIGGREGGLVSEPITEIQRNNTAHAILDSSSDILAVQEVENLYTIRLFNHTYLDDYFDRMVLIDGNDPRGIDVGLCLRKGFPAEITAIRTHVDEAVGNASVSRGSNAFGYLATKALFSRDCLEVDIAINGKVLTFLVNHFKAQDGKPASVQRRKQQAERTVQIAADAEKAGRLPIILGDLNTDHRLTKDGSLDPLYAKKSVVRDPFPADTWTHYYVPDKKATRLDYILPHKSLKVADTHIVRKGLTTKAKIYTGPRYPTVGQEHTEASDHCPTSVVLDL